MVSLRSRLASSEVRWDASLARSLGDGSSCLCFTLPSCRHSVAAFVTFTDSGVPAALASPACPSSTEKKNTVGQIGYPTRDLHKVKVTETLCYLHNWSHYGTSKSPTVGQTDNPIRDLHKLNEFGTSISLRLHMWPHNGTDNKHHSWSDRLPHKGFTHLVKVTADITKTFCPSPDQRTGKTFENPGFTGPPKVLPDHVIFSLLNRIIHLVIYNGFIITMALYCYRWSLAN